MTAKEHVIASVKALLQHKIDLLKAGLADLQQGLSSQTKSSAGDKHETGRAQTHLEQEKLSNQLSILDQQLNQIISLRTTTSDRVVPGSLVSTDQGKFFLAVPVGKILSNGEEILGISPTSPVGQQLINKKPGDKVRFNQIEYLILDID